MSLTAVFMQVPEGYIGFVEELPGANTLGDTLEETRINLQEAVKLVLEANRQLTEEMLIGLSAKKLATKSKEAGEAERLLIEANAFVALCKRFTLRISRSVASVEPSLIAITSRRSLG